MRASFFNPALCYHTTQNNERDGSRSDPRSSEASNDPMQRADRKWNALRVPRQSAVRQPLRTTPERSGSRDRGPELRDREEVPDVSPVNAMTTYRAHGGTIDATLPLSGRRAVPRSLDVPTSVGTTHRTRAERSARWNRDRATGPIDDYREAADNVPSAASDPRRQVEAAGLPAASTAHKVRRVGCYALSSQAKANSLLLYCCGFGPK